MHEIERSVGIRSDHLDPLTIYCPAGELCINLSSRLTTSEREKISFHQLNKNTGHRIKYRKVDADSGDEVESADIIKGYEVGKGEYLELEPEEL